jgi:hypothetical protein
VDPVDVTIISCLYGRSHDEFFGEWLAAVKSLDPAPREIIVATDRYRHLTDGVLEVFRRRNDGSAYPQPFFLNAALFEVRTEWTWIHDIDDVAFHDALDGFTAHTEDVVQMGYVRSDGETHLPPAYGPVNQYVAGSIVRTAALRAVGGWRDVEHQDSDLWQRLLDAGAIFAAADRPRFYYRRHANARTEREAGDVVTV